MLATTAEQQSKQAHVTTHVAADAWTERLAATVTAHFASPDETKIWSNGYSTNIPHAAFAASAAS